MSAKDGDRVELVRCDDPYTKLEPGERGTVLGEPDANGTVSVRWDCGSMLGMIPGVDEFRIVKETTKEEHDGSE